MDVEHLRNRIKRETRLDEVIPDDYMITTVESKAEQRHKSKVAVRKADSKDEVRELMLNLKDHRKEDIGIMRLEFILPNGDRGEWLSEQISEEVMAPPYVTRERKLEKDTHNGEDAVYVAEYAIHKSFIKDS